MAKYSYLVISGTDVVPYFEEDYSDAVADRVERGGILYTWDQAHYLFEALDFYLSRH